MNIQEYIKKLQELPEFKKKIIFFAVVIISALIMGFFAVKSTKNNISKLGQSLKSVDLPKIDISDIQRNTSSVDNNTPILSPESQISDTLSSLSIDNWKTYTNTQYGFEIKYPADWQIQDNTYIINKILYPLFSITSPNRLDLPDYQGIAIHYLIHISFDPSNKKLTTYVGFAKATTSGDQSYWNTNISDSATKLTDEYKIGQEIIATFKFTN